MKKITGSQIITVLATIVVLVVNILANALPLNGLETGDISDRFKIMFVPAGYVFSIWGLIYLGLILYAVFQALPSQAENEVLKKIAPYYWISSVANSVWIFLWHYEVFSFTLAAMLVILATLILISLSLVKAEGSLKWLVRLPFSIYLGWISVATIANVSQTLYFFNWSGWGISASTWTVFMLAAAVILGVLKLWIENDTPYTLVLIWALVGIVVSQAGNPVVVTASWTSVGLIAAAAAANLIRTKKLY